MLVWPQPVQSWDEEPGASGTDTTGTGTGGWSRPAEIKRPCSLDTFSNSISCTQHEQRSGNIIACGEVKTSIYRARGRRCWLVCTEQTLN
jgi:hypothetical protein